MKLLWFSGAVAILAQLQAAPSSASEWTFERAMQCWSPMWRPTQHVGVPGYQWQPVVLWDGSLVCGPTPYPRANPTIDSEARATVGENYLHLCVAYGSPMRFVDRTGRKSTAIRRRLTDGRLPMPIAETIDGDLVWQETVFSHLLGRDFGDGMKPRPDDKLVTHLRFRVRNTGSSRGTGHLWFCLADLSKTDFVYASIVSDELGKPLPHSYEIPFGFLADKVRYILPSPAKGKLNWHDEVPSPEGASTPAANVIEWQVPLDPGEEADLTMIVPLAPVDRATAELVVALDSEKLYEDARRFWNKLTRGRGRIVTPDPLINDYLVAVGGQISQQVAYRHQANQWHYKTAPNVNEMYWPCNAAMALPTFDLKGLTELSRPVLRTFVDTQGKGDDIPGLAADRRHGEEGKLGDKGLMGGEGFASKPGFLGYNGGWTAASYLLSHGLEMWALAQHYRITRDDDWLGSGPGSHLQAMLDGFDWVVAQRRQTMREMDDARVAHWGLLPAAAAHDWFAGNTVFNDAFCIYGMAEVVRLLHETGHPRAEEMAGELADYRECLRDRYAEARDRARKLPLADGTEIPFVPRDVYELDWAKIDWTYTILGPLRAGAWGVFEPDDELVDQSLAFLEAGMPKSEGAYVNIRPYTADENWTDISDPSAGRHYLWRHYVEYETMWPTCSHLFLARDDLPRFFEWFFNTMAVTIHHDWLVGVEALDGTPSNAPGDAERWRAVRNMFVNERGGYDGSEQELFLLQAIPRSWLRPGGRMSVSDMGTCFGGSVDLDVRVGDDGNSVTVRATLDGLAVEPARIRMRLRSGDGRPLVSAEVSGRPVRVLEGDIVELPRVRDGKYTVVGAF